MANVNRAKCLHSPSMPALHTHRPPLTVVVAPSCDNYTETDELAMV